MGDIQQTTVQSSLEALFKKIFDFKDVSFSAPGEAREQEKLFVEVELCRTRILDKREISRVQGKASVFVNGDKVPFGYFAKCIANHPDETKDLFFSDIEENQRLYENIVQRGFSFVYLFDSQYDPDLGTLNQVDIEVTT